MGSKNILRPTTLQNLVKEDAAFYKNFPEEGVFQDIHMTKEGLEEEPI